MEEYKEPKSPVNPTPCKPNSPTQFEIILAGFGKDLDSQLITAAADLNNLTLAAGIAGDSVCTSRDTVLSLTQARELYTQLSNCITIAATKEAELMVAAIKEVTDKNNKLAETYKAATDAIKLARQKINQVKTNSDKLSADIANLCNSAELKIINDKISKTQDTTSLEISAATVGSYASKITKSINEVVASSVKVSVINAFVNTKSITDAGGNAKAGADALGKDVDTNLTSLQKDHDAARTALATNQAQFSTATLSKYKAVAFKKSLDWTKKLSVDPDCDKCGNSEKLDDLVTKSSATFNEVCK